MSPQSFRNKVKSEMVGIQSPVYKQFLKIINQVNSDGESQVTGEQKIQDASQEPIVTENDEDDNNVAISTSTASLPFHSLNAKGGAEESDRERIRHYQWTRSCILVSRTMKKLINSKITLTATKTMTAEASYQVILARQDAVDTLLTCLLF